MHKLRTMSVDAEARLPEVRYLNERMGPLFKTETTLASRVSARSSRHEPRRDPQLIDVLRGDMSLIGPRPALPAEVAEFDDELLARIRVRRASPVCGRSKRGTNHRSTRTVASICSTWRTGRSCSTLPS